MEQMWFIFLVTSYHEAFWISFYFKGTIDCSVWCKGKYTTNPEYVACVNYSINFHINKTLTTKLKDVACSITSCIVKVIDFDCMFKTDKENTSQQTAKDGSCIGNV